MSYSELNQLILAEKLFDTGKLDETLEILNDESLYERLSLQQKSHFQFLKGLILFYQFKNEELIKLGEEIFKEGQELNDKLQSFDGLFFAIIGLSQTFKFEEAHKLIEKAEALLKLPHKTSEIKLIRREARLSLLKSMVYMRSNNLDLGEKFLEKTLGFAKEIENTFEMVWANTLMARIMWQGKAKFDLAKEYCTKALLLAKKIKFNHYWIAVSNLYFALTNLWFCEYNISLKHYLTSLELFRKINNIRQVASCLNDMGDIYATIGDYDIALKYYQESLLLRESQTQDMSIEIPLFNLGLMALDYGDNVLAQKYFNRLEYVYNQKKGSGMFLFYPLMFSLSKALMLKVSSRTRDKAKAEESLKEIIETDTIWPKSHIIAIIHLCDLLLAEFRQNNNSEILDEINYYVAKLLTIAEEQHSYLVFCEAFILQAKLALLNFEMKAARRFLTQAQKIAESYGIKRLAMKISYEHDELLKKSKMWENLKESGATLSERWKLAGLNEQMENMVKNRMIAAPETSEENPVSVLIITEGGIPLLSHSFIEIKEFESHLFSGFLTTINYFMKETFSEDLDRFVFGKYTLLMKSVAPFFICYVYEGESYYAFQRLKSFIEDIQNEGIWQILIRYFQANRFIHLKEIPLLESVVTETFIVKNVALN
ncbi:MAG: tetratricopeptide repeat protein [Candidatus Lokiarchaeota archaeon]|nr:tetratricopeptide repeat protein [Candidatus Lokiarchaeota archaeon]